VQDGDRAVTLRCPRCAAPIVCSVRGREHGLRVETAARSCRCQLDGDEWDGLRRQIAALLERGDDPGRRAGRAGYHASRDTRWPGR
jgi:hypothetical protein